MKIKTGSTIFQLFLIVSFVAITPLVVQAVPVSFSFDTYSGPTALTIYAGGEIWDQSNGIMNGNVLPVDSAMGKVTVSSEIIDGKLWEVIEDRGSTSISGSPSSVSFKTATSISNPTVLSFTPSASTEVAAGTPFLLGTFSFTNGNWFTDPLGSTFTFTITASSLVAGLTDQQFHGTLILYTNLNDKATKEERADWFYIMEKPELGSVRVLEIADGNNIGTVEFWGKFGSLDFVDIRNPSGGAFLNPSTESNPVSVPEPGSLILVGIGVLGMAAMRARNRKL